MEPITITEFTDPGCPFGYSCEPVRLRIKWFYGEHVDWHLRLIGLADSVEQYERVGFTPEIQSSSHAKLAERYGMPFDLSVRSRMSATVPACRAVVAARLNVPEREWLLLRELRVHCFGGELLDDPATIAAAAVDAGIDPEALAAWMAEPRTDAALEEDMRLARVPSAAARALAHKLGGPSDARRYSPPSYEITGPSGSTFAAPGVHPAAVYEVLIANAAPDVPRREAPADVGELLAWCDAPPSSAEVAEVLGVTIEEAREALGAVATLDPVGADGFWRLPATLPEANH